MSVSSEEILDRPARLGRRRPRGTTARFRAGYDARLAHAAGITLYESFEAAEPVWREFETHAAGTAFQSFDWLSAWYRHVGRELGVTPAIAVVTRQGAPLMLAPLGIERRFGLSLLVWMGGRLADYKGPLLAPDFEARLDVEFATLWRQIRRALPRHDLVMLDSQPVSLGTPAAPFGNPFAALSASPAPDAAYVFDLPETFEEFSQRYRAETRRIDRSKFRKLEAEGEVSFRIAATPEERVAMTEEILARKAEQLAQQGISSIFEEENYLAAWRDLAGLPDEQAAGSGGASPRRRVPFGQRFPCLARPQHADGAYIRSRDAAEALARTAAPAETSAIEHRSRNRCLRSLGRLCRLQGKFLRHSDGDAQCDCGGEPCRTWRGGGDPRGARGEAADQERSQAHEPRAEGEGAARLIHYIDIYIANIMGGP